MLKQDMVILVLLMIGGPGVLVRQEETEQETHTSKLKFFFLENTGYTLELSHHS